MRGSTILFGVAVIALVIGTALGSFAFPVTKTETTTQTISTTASTSATVTQTISVTTIVSQNVTQTETVNASSATTTSTSVVCSISAAGTGSYVTVESDAGQPLQGIQVSGTIVTQISNEGNCQQNIGIFQTNSTGTALITQTSGSYYMLSILYQGRDYTATASIDPFQSTYVTLRVPSGNVSVSEIPYGGCLRNATATICPS